MATPRTDELSQHDWVVVDVETTGLSPYHDVIIEIAALHLTNGAIAGTFHTLIDPGVPLPPFIRTLTGLSDADLRGQPSLPDIAADLVAFLGDRVFVAHNATFDYHFVRQGLRRAGVAYRTATCCTLQLGRQLLPAGRRTLESMLARAGIRVPAEGQRHRALGDAQATASLFLHLLDLAKGQAVETPTALRGLGRQPTPTRQLPGGDAADLPTSPGVYLMRDAQGQILYIGKAKNVRRRVQTHFRPSDPAQPRLKRTLPQVAQVDVVSTGSELEALLLESRLIKQYLPSANIALRDYANYPFLRMDLNEPYPRVAMTRTPVADGAAYFGPFNRSGPVHTAVELVEDLFLLARCTGPIIPGVTQPCLYGQMGRCLQPCTGAVTQRAYGEQVERARRFLDGTDRQVLVTLEGRRDRLAEALRFEEAAQVRDQIAELDYVFGTQQRLNLAVAEHHLVVIAPSTEASAVELFCIRAGCLARHERWRTAGSGREWLVTLLREAYLGDHEAGIIGKEQVDELHIISAWLRQSRGQHVRVPVPAEDVDPEAVADAVLQAYGQFATSADRASA